MRIASIKVPQADSLEVLLLLIELVGHGQSPSVTSLGISKRQIDYYKNAAGILGFVTLKRAGLSKASPKIARLSSSGRALLTLPEKARLSRMALAFAVSDVGRLWTAWARAKTLPEVNRDSAEDFIRQTTNLKGTTAGRRIQTLHAWHDRLMPHHPARNAVPSLPRSRPPRSPTPRHVLGAGESGQVIEALTPGSTLVRIMTAYLSINGWKIFCAGLRDAHVKILVGSEMARDGIRDIIEWLKKSTESGPPVEDRRRAIRDLQTRVTVGTVMVRTFEPKYLDLHAKVYVFDDDVVYSGSANLSQRGMRGAIENGSTTDDVEGVHFHIRKFDELFDKAEDISAKVLEVLEDSWAFVEPVSPYILYLRALLELFPNPPEMIARGRYRLSPYQNAIVATVLGTLRERHAALLVSPTGTGKTVMASYMAATLMEIDRAIRRIVILCPTKSLEDMWRATLLRCGMSAHVITHGRLQGKGRPSVDAAQRLEEELSYLDEHDFVIVDECHAFRNPKSNGYERLSRLSRRFQSPSRPWLLLLSATPMSKDIRDLDTLVGLLGEAPLSSISQLPNMRSVVNVTLPFIVKHFAVEGSDGGLLFDGHLKYFAKIRVQTHRYKSSFDKALRLVEKTPLALRDATDDCRIISSKILQFSLCRRIESSPAAALRTIQRFLQYLAPDAVISPVDPDTYETNLLELTAMLEHVPKDNKLEALAQIICQNPQRKVLIFSQYSTTVHYIAEKLSRLQPELRIDTIDGRQPTRLRKDKIGRFAPRAQKRSRRARKNDIDVLVATDAIAEGENLQDAEIVINYDLTWTPLTLIQRIGRVDRATPERRNVAVYNFFPEGRVFERILGLWERLDERSALYGSMSRVNVVGEHVRDLAQLEDRDIGLMSRLYDREDYEGVLEEYLPVSSWLEDRATATAAEIERALALPMGIQACRISERAGTFALLRTSRGLHGVFLPAGEGPLEVSPAPIAHEVMMRLIRADRKELAKPSPISHDERIDRILQLWATQFGCQVGDIQVICSETLERTP